MRGNTHDTHHRARHGEGSNRQRVGVAHRRKGRMLKILTGRLKRRRAMGIIIPAALAILTFIASFIPSTSFAGGKAPAGATPAGTLVLGVAGPQTGRHAAMLSAIQLGVTQGLAQWQARDPAKPPSPPRSEVVDDGCAPETARGAAAALVALRVTLVIGHPCPAAAIAAAPVYAAAGIPFIALGVRHPDLTDRRAGPATFRLAGRDDRQGEAAGAILMATAPQRRIAIIQDRTAYARAILASTLSALEKHAVGPVTVVPIVAGRRDYDAQLTELAQTRPETVLFAGYPAEASVILRGMVRAGLPAVLVGSDAVATPEFADTVRQTGREQRVRVLVPASTAATLLAGTDAGTRSPWTGEPTSNPLLGAFALTAVEIWNGIENAPDDGSAGGLADAIATRRHLTSTFSSLTFDARGDASIPSFTASELVEGQWSSVRATIR